MSLCEHVCVGSALMIVEAFYDNDLSHLMHWEMRLTLSGSEASRSGIPSHMELMACERFTCKASAQNAAACAPPWPS